MSPWELAAAVLLATFLPCGFVMFRGRTLDRLIALEAAGILAVMEICLLKPRGRCKGGQRFGSLSSRREDDTNKRNYIRPGEGRPTIVT